MSWDVAHIATFNSKGLHFLKKQYSYLNADARHTEMLMPRFPNGPAQVYSVSFAKILRNFTKHLQTTAFENLHIDTSTFIHNRCIISDPLISKKLRMFARIHTSSRIKIEKILNRPITKFYNSDDVNVIAAELRLIKTRPTSLNKRHNLL